MTTPISMKTLLLFGVIGFLIFSVVKQPTAPVVPIVVPPTTTPTSDITQPGAVQCSYAPTAQLGANDKFAAGQTNWGTWKYKLNGGTTTTDADGSFEVSIGDALKVLVADANSSLFYRALWEPTINKCGLNTEAYNEVYATSRYTVKCENDLGQPINGTQYFASYANYTVGSGGSLTSECKLTEAANTGMPDLDGDGYGGVLFLELNKTTWKENELGVTWDGKVLVDAGSLSAYQNGVSTGGVRAFKVPSFGGKSAIDHKFTISVSSESGQNPAVGYTDSSSYGDSIIGFLVPENCYEEEDVTPSEFRCGMQDIDNLFTAPGGTTKSSASITTFAIPVQ